MLGFISQHESGIYKNRSSKQTNKQKLPRKLRSAQQNPKTRGIIRAIYCRITTGSVSG